MPPIVLFHLDGALLDGAPDMLAEAMPELPAQPLDPARGPLPPQDLA
ncbi:MAG: hypothetical protein QM601_00720 [Pseudoxanthomonas sp.]